MKVFAVFVLVLTALAPCHADTWDVAASCESGFQSGVPTPCTDPANINAVFTTQMEFGTFVNPSNTEGETIGSVPVVTNISGTFDRMAMSLVLDPSGDWLLGSYPEVVLFNAGGSEYMLFWDGDTWLAPLSAPSPVNGLEILNWSAFDLTAMPEPGVFWLLVIAVFPLGLSRWAQLSLREFSRAGSPRARDLDKR